MGKSDIKPCVQGTNDQFYKQNQLLPEKFIEAARKAGHDESQVEVKLHDGYDHSYYFVGRSLIDFTCQ
jgi:S-formylglutathione hydrolase